MSSVWKGLINFLKILQFIKKILTKNTKFQRNDWFKSSDLPDSSLLPNLSDENLQKNNFNIFGTKSIGWKLLTEKTSSGAWLFFLIQGTHNWGGACPPAVAWRENVPQEGGAEGENDNCEEEKFRFRLFPVARTLLPQHLSGMAVFRLKIG